MLLTVNFEAAYQAAQLASFLSNTIKIRLVSKELDDVVNDVHLLIGTAMDFAAKKDLLKCKDIKWAIFDDADITMSSKNVISMVLKLKQSTNVRYISAFNAKPQIQDALPPANVSHVHLDNDSYKKLHYGIALPSSDLLLEQCKLKVLISICQYQINHSKHAVVVICKVFSLDLI